MKVDGRMSSVKEKGFTLIELLAVILILGIIALIAIPVVNKILIESRLNAFKTTVTTLAKKAEENCQLEGIKNKKITKLYTIVDGKFDHRLKVKGEIPNEGYILVNNNCEVAYTFYDGKNTISKNYNEKKQLLSTEKDAFAYGLEWRSNISTLDDTYTRTLDASGIANNNVKVQIGDKKNINVFDSLDIYKDILPYKDEFKNEFMLIPKFYISKTKEVTETEVIWNYAISKHKLDDTYYLPSNFIDEGINNDKKIELPYILVGKYEAGSNGLSGDLEMLVSKSGIFPKMSININNARTLATRYNDIEGVSGYQQYDIHTHDLLTMLFVIEFATMNSQSIMKGYVDNSSAIKTGGSDFIDMSSGTLLNDGHNSFNYRGIENLWGNVRCFVEGVNIDQINDTKNTIYIANNARHYSSNSITEYYSKLNEYKKINMSGFVKESGFDQEFPFINLPIKVDGNSTNGMGDLVYHYPDSGIKILLASGDWASGDTAGLGNFILNWDSNYISHVGARILKTPMK